MALTTVRPDGVGFDTGRRNMFINGGMLVSQRGTTFSETTAASYTTDRWLRHVGSSFNFDTTITQSTTVPAGTGLTHSLKVEADAAVTPSSIHNAGIGQRIEGDTMKRLAYGAATGKSATLSFWVRSNKTGTYCVMFGMNNGSSTSSEKYLHVKEYTISSADTWEHKTILLPANTTQAITTSTSEGFRIIWWLVVGSGDHVSADSWIQDDAYRATSNQVNFMDSADNEWYLTGCQFELGENASDFEHRSYGEELALCQRYYHQLVDGNNQAIGQGSYYNSGIWQVHVDFPTTMRATPDLIITAAADHYNITSGNANDSINGDDNIQSASTRACFLQFTTNVSGTQGNGGHVHSARSTSSVAFDAEL